VSASCFSPLLAPLQQECSRRRLAVHVQAGKRWHTPSMRISQRYHGFECTRQHVCPFFVPPSMANNASDAAAPAGPRATVATATTSNSVISVPTARSGQDATCSAAATQGVATNTNPSHSLSEFGMTAAAQLTGGGLDQPILQVDALPPLVLGQAMFDYPRQAVKRYPSADQTMPCRLKAPKGKRSKEEPFTVPAFLLDLTPEELAHLHVTDLWLIVGALYRQYATTTQARAERASTPMARGQKSGRSACITTARTTLRSSCSA
jgi:hypothetical protein